MNTWMFPLLACALIAGCASDLPERPGTDTSADAVGADTRDPRPVDWTAGCLELDGSLTVTVTTDVDAMLALALVLPAQRERHVPLRLYLGGIASAMWSLDHVVVHFGAGSDPVVLDAADALAAGAYAGSASMQTFALDADVPAPSAVVVTFAADNVPPCEVTRALGDDALADLGARVTGAAEGAGGALWTATVANGLIGHAGLGADAPTVVYDGVASLAPYELTWNGPQSGLVLALARQGARGLWLGTAATGLSWFDPGDDALATGDDVWLHHLPPPPGVEDLRELRETATALAADGVNGVYVGTLDGLWYVRHDGDPAEVAWERLASGPVFALAVLDDGSLLVGFTTAVTAAELVDGPLAGAWRLADAPLLHLDVADTPDDPDDDVATWLPVGDAVSVTALLPRPGGALIGSDRGLFAWRAAAATTPPAPLSAVVGPDLAVTSLAALPDGAWVSARDMCDAGHGLLARVTLDLADADPVHAIVPADLAGLGIAPYVSLVQVLSSGDLVVSTLVADTWNRDLTPPACREAVEPRNLPAETWIVPVDGGPATPL